MILVNDKQLEKIRNAFLIKDHDAVASSVPLTSLKKIRISKNPGQVASRQLNWNSSMDDLKGEELFVGGIGVLDSAEVDGEQASEIYFRAGRKDPTYGNETFFNFHPEWIDDPTLTKILEGEVPAAAPSNEIGWAPALGVSAVMLLGQALANQKKRKEAAVVPQLEEVQEGVVVAASVQ